MLSCPVLSFDLIWPVLIPHSVLHFLLPILKWTAINKITLWMLFEMTFLLPCSSTIARLHLSNYYIRNLCSKGAKMKSILWNVRSWYTLTKTLLGGMVALYVSPTNWQNQPCVIQKNLFQDQFKFTIHYLQENSNIFLTHLNFIYIILW